MLKKRCHDIVLLLNQKLKEAVKFDNVDNEDDFNRVLVCNNASWTIGELAIKMPEFVKPFLIEIMNSLAEILNTDIITQLSQRNELFLQHFAKTVSITMGRLGKLDP